MSEASAPYRIIQPPRWKKRYSFGLLYLIVFLAATMTPMSLAIVETVNGGYVVRTYGFPSAWLGRNGNAPASWVIMSCTGLTIDLLLYATVCVIVVYPRNLIHGVKHALRP